MSRSVNKITLLGNIGRDPEIRTTASGTKIASVSLATSRRIPRDGADEERTEWHRLVLWDKLAQLAEDYIRKGDRVYVEGRMEYDTYEKNGVTIPTAEVNVREVVFLGGGEKREAATTPASKTASRSPFDADPDDSPF